MEENIFVQSSQILLTLVIFIAALLVMDTVLKFIQALRKELKRRQRGRGTHTLTLQAVVVLPIDAALTQDEIESLFQAMQHDLAHDLGWVIDDQFIDEETGDLIGLISRPVTGNPYVHLNEVNQAGYTIGPSALLIQ